MALPFPDSSPPSAPFRRARLFAWLTAGFVLLVPIVNFAAFSRLFWFGDELDLIDQIDHIGLWRWVWLPFAENFVPLFKLGFGGLIFAGHGSYLFLLVTIWLVHAVNVGVLVGWLLELGVHAAGAVMAGLIFGLSGSNLETLTWPVQSSAVLATLFFLLAARTVIRTGPDAISPRRVGGVIAAGAASALAFSRGVLTGPVVAALWLDPTLASSESTGRRVRTAALWCLPSVAIGLLIYHLAPSSHRSVFSDADQLRQAAGFATWFFCLNPTVSYFSISPLNWGIPAVGWTSVVVVGAVKIGFIGLGFACGTSRQRRMLAALLLLDLFSAFLLGYGRGESDLSHALSSRYQYNSLLCFVPFLAVVIGRGLQSLARLDREVARDLRARFPAQSFIRRPEVGGHLSGNLSRQLSERGGSPRRFAAVLLGTCLCLLPIGYAYGKWRQLLPPWAEWRGQGTRRLLFETKPLPPGNDLVGIPFLPNARAKELADKYHLH